VDEQIRIAVIGMSHLTDNLKMAAEQHMNHLLQSKEIEYIDVTPHGLAEDVAATIFGLQPHVILLGWPQNEVSSWDIAAGLEGYQVCPIITIRMSGHNGADIGKKPNGCLDLMESDINGICKAIENKLLPRKAAASK